MNIISYALMTYGLTAVIALFVVAVIVGISKATGGSSTGEDE
jgi:VIT1/CCC1 family predicted Fe2+/Mn2+ transporter